MRQISSYTLRILGLLFLSGLLIYTGLMITFQYVKDNVHETRGESIQFVATEIHDRIIELNLMSSYVKVQQYLSNYFSTEEVSIYKVHVLDRNFTIVASTDLHFVGMKFYDESYRQVKERLRSYITNKKYENVSYVECAYPIKSSIFIDSASRPSARPSEILGILLVWKRASPISELIYSDYPNWVVIAVLIFTLLIVISIGYYVNRFFANLGSISGKAQKIALGDFKERIQFEGGSEFGLLAESFNQIADNLEGRIRETSDINKKLAESNKEKEKQVDILSQMAGGVAHEVRNPLGGIRGFAELLKADIDSGDATKLKYIQYILDEVKTLESLVQNVLDFARPKRPNMTRLNFEIVMDAISNIVQGRIEEAARKDVKIDFSYSIRPEANETTADPSQIRQVILNLALNACDAMSEPAASGGGKLEITIEKIGTREMKAGYDIRGDNFASGDFALVKIADNGCGMAPDVIDNLFTPFYTTKASGTGLGLSICRKIVENHRGFIKVSSESGKGTTFFVFIPLLKE